MNKTYIAICSILITCFVALFVSCGDDDDNYTIDEVWKQRNEVLFEEAKASGEYRRINTSSYQSGNRLYILAKPSNTINTDVSLAPLINNNGYAEFTDTIICRYEGWLYDKNNEKYIFDSTENKVTGGTSSSHPNYVPVKLTVSNIIEGWRTALTEMKEGDELEIVVPYQLGYGISGSSDPIKPYTTLYFRIKLLKIVPMTGKK